MEVDFTVLENELPLLKQPLNIAYTDSPTIFIHYCFLLFFKYIALMLVMKQMYY